jgi:hypothetical protein
MTNPIIAISAMEIASDSSYRTISIEAASLRSGPWFHHSRGQ